MESRKRVEDIYGALSNKHSMGAPYNNYAIVTATIKGPNGQQLMSIMQQWLRFGEIE